MSFESRCIPITEWPPKADGNNETEDEDETNNEEEVETGEPNFERVKRLKYDESYLEKIKFSFPTAEKNLTSWVRRNFTHFKKMYKFPETASPRTLLNIVGESIEGKVFLNEAISELNEEYRNVKTNPSYFYILATYFDRLHDYKMALENVERSLNLLSIDLEVFNMSVTEYKSFLGSLDEHQKNVLWLYSKLSLANSRRDIKTFPKKSKMVAKVDYREINLKKFKEEFCKNKTPAIFTCAPSPTKVTWSLEFIKEKAGDCKFEVKTPTAWSTDWAGLETSGWKTVSQFLTDRVPGDGQYLFDWSLPLHAPLLNENFSTPELFQDNYLTQTSSQALYHNSWPSLFITQAGTNSGLHIDAFASHFWMFLVSGCKRWTFYATEDAGSLNPIYYDSLDPVFRPTKEQLEAVDSYTVELQEGELLFVPSGSPHMVENMQDTVAVSGNFVNATNSFNNSSALGSVNSVI